MKKISATDSRKQGYVVAMVLGSALSTFGAAPATAAAAPTTQAACDISRYCTEEVFCRLLERVTPEAWDQVLVDDREERRELIRAIDAVRKRSQRSRKW